MNNWVHFETSLFFFFSAVDTYSQVQSAVSWETNLRESKLILIMHLEEKKSRFPILRPPAWAVHSAQE